MKHKKQVSRTVKTQAHNIYYPAFLNLEDKKTVVVGGGKVAERKILGLLNAQAEVTVVSPVITKRLEQEEQKGRIRHICRKYRKGDLKNAFLVIAATDSEDINEKVSRDAPCLVNVVDTPKFCNFIVPSILQRGPLTIAISTERHQSCLRTVVAKGPGEDLRTRNVRLPHVFAENTRTGNGCNSRREEEDPVP